jgi:hypothetical protein
VILEDDISQMETPVLIGTGFHSKIGVFLKIYCFYKQKQKQVATGFASKKWHLIQLSYEFAHT